MLENNFGAGNLLGKLVLDVCVHPDDIRFLEFGNKIEFWDLQKLCHEFGVSDQINLFFVN